MTFHFHKFDNVKFNDVLSLEINSNTKEMYFTYKDIDFKQAPSIKRLLFTPSIPDSIGLPSEQFVRDLVKSLAEDLDCYVEADASEIGFFYACYQTTEIKDSTREPKLFPSLQKLADQKKDFFEE